MTGKGTRAGLLAAVVLLGLAAPAVACVVPQGAEAAAARLLDGVNLARARAGLRGLRPASGLQRAAQAHACDNARTGRLTHTGSDGSAPADRIRRAGYRPALTSENVAVGYRTPAAVVDGWMGSRPHRRNILSARATEVGFGLARGADGRLHWVMKAAVPR